MFPDDLIPRATQVLLPRWATPDERSAWLAQAFFLAEPRLYNDLRLLDGQPIIVLTNTITALLEAGCLPNKKAHSLAQLLTSVRIIASPEAQAEIDRLVPLLNNACADAKTKTITSVMNTLDSSMSSLKTAVSSLKRPANALQSYETPLAERTPTVFISYSHADDDFALRLISDLQGGGHAVWIDKMNIKGGAEWVRSIADGISNSYAFVSVLSPDANTSRWVQREYLYADNLGKPIFPVMARPSEVPFQMIDRQVLSLIEDYALGLEQLLTVLPTPRAITLTPAMMQPVLRDKKAAPSKKKKVTPPKPESAILGGVGADDANIPMPAPSPVPPAAPQPAPAFGGGFVPPTQPASAPLAPPQAYPAPYVLSRKSSNLRRLTGLVGVLVVGAIGISVVLSSMNSAPLPPATQVGMATQGVMATAMGGTLTNDPNSGLNATFNSNVSPLLLLMLVVLVGAGAFAVYFWLNGQRAAAVGTSPQAKPDIDLSRQPARGGTRPGAAAKPVETKEESRKEAEARLDDVLSAPEPELDEDEESDEEVAPVMPVVDRRALELLYINRITTQRVDAMVDMNAPTPQDRVRVMALTGSLNTPAVAWDAVSRQAPDEGGIAAVSMRRALVMGDDRQDSMTALWAAAGALMHFATTDPTQPIPVIIDVSRWMTDIPLEAYIQAEMGELGMYLDSLLRDKRVALFFDGLYTISDAKKLQIEAFLNTHPDLMAVIDLTTG